MAAGFAITSEGGQYYNGKMTLFVVLSCIVAATGGLIFGYDIGISGLFIYLIKLYLYISLFLSSKFIDWLNSNFFLSLYSIKPITDLGLTYT